MDDTARFCVVVLRPRGLRRNLSLLESAAWRMLPEVYSLVLSLYRTCLTVVEVRDVVVALAKKLHVTL